MDRGSEEKDEEQEFEVNGCLYEYVDFVCGFALNSSAGQRRKGGMTLRLGGAYARLDACV